MNEILLVTIAFSPNVGGIETHFDDLTRSLDKLGWKIWVLTYKPITTDIEAPLFEKRDGNTFIYRIPWLNGVFYKLVKTPVLEFIFLAPGLFLILPILLLTKFKNVKTIHSHGLVAGFVSVFWGKIFAKKVITTTHSIYQFPKNGIYRFFSKWIFENSDSVLCLSEQAAQEIKNLGIDKKKVKVFTYWIDLNRFKIPDSKLKIKKRLGWEGKFIILFVGRLIEEKGINVLLESVKTWDKNITLIIIGTGPLAGKITNSKIQIPNLEFMGKIDNARLPSYYQAADLLIVPSVHEEGFGRIILESLACGTPVIGSNRGAIPEAMDNTVGKIIQVTPENIRNTVEYFYRHPEYLINLSKKARIYAENKYSDSNINIIISEYT